MDKMLKIETPLDQAVEERNRRAILSRFNCCDDIGTLTIVANFLGDTSPVVCKAAVDALVRCANPVVAQATSLHLHSSNPSERGYALAVLSSLGENALFELGSLLQDPEPDIRKYACYALVNIPGKISADLLCSVLQDKTPEVAAAAADALGHLACQDTNEPLMQAFQDSSSLVRSAILKALGNIGGSSALAVISQNAHKMSDEELCIAIQSVADAGESDPGLAWSFLMDCFGSGNPAVQSAVLTGTIKLLARGLILPDVCQEFILKISENKAYNSTPDLQPAGGHNFNPQTNPHALQQILLLADDPALNIEEVALKSLLESGVCSLTELLQVAENHQVSEEMRLLALRKFSHGFEPPRLLPVGIDKSLERFIQETGLESLKTAAICALLCVFPARGVPLIVSSFKGGSDEQKGCLLKELAECPPHELTLLMIEGYEDRNLRLALFELFNLEKNRVFFKDSIYGQTLLIANMGDEDWMIRANTVNILSHTASAWAENLVRQACFDLDDRVRFRALEAVLKGDTQKIDPNWLDSIRKDESAHIRKLVNDYLEQVPQPV